MEKELQVARTEVQGVREELRQVGRIANGKKYLVQSVFRGNRFALLTRVGCSACVFVELSKNVAAAVKHYATHEEDSMQRLFWSQFLDSEHPPLLINQMKQLMEMHQMSELAVKDLCVSLWPAESIMDTYFGLGQKL